MTAKTKKKESVHPRHLTLDQRLDLLVERGEAAARQSEVDRDSMAQFKARVDKFAAAVEKDRDNHEGHRRNLSRALGNAFALSLPRAMREAHGIVIKAKDIRLRVKKRKGGVNMAVGFVAPNSKLVLAGEVKTHLTQRDVENFTGRLLGGFRWMFPEYAGLPVHGVVAGCEIDEDAARFAHYCGFVILQMTGAEVHPATPVGGDKKIREPKAY